MTSEERKAARARFDRLAVEFWKEYREAVEPIEKRYGMYRCVGGYDTEDDIATEPWSHFRSVYSIEEELSRRES